MAAEKKKKNPYDFWVKFVLFLFIAMLLSILVEQIQEENFKRRPILEVTNVIKITKKDVIVISFTDFTIPPYKHIITNFLNLVNFFINHKVKKVS